MGASKPAHLEKRFSVTSNLGAPRIFEHVNILKTTQITNLSQINGLKHGAGRLGPSKPPPPKKKNSIELMQALKFMNRQNNAGIKLKMAWLNPQNFSHSSQIWWLHRIASIPMPMPRMMGIRLKLLHGIIRPSAHEGETCFGPQPRKIKSQYEKSQERKPKARPWSVSSRANCTLKSITQT
jgi:hypothetical protein